MKVEIAGFVGRPKLRANGSLYRGRFECAPIQWTGLDADVVATFTITAGELTDAAEAGLLWTDQDVQRGIQPTAEPLRERELSLASGYPDSTKYVFDADNADDMAEKLLRGDQLFLGPLIWNLRPGTFEAYWHASDQAIFIYQGRIYLPDSHHRQQAIIKAVRAYRESPREFPKFNESKEFSMELYFLSRDDEGNYFFDKNQRTKPTAKSKAYDLTTQDDLSILAKLVIDKSDRLRGNVNRVTDRLVARNPQVMTLSTLREMMRTLASEPITDEAQLEGTALIAAEFYDLLAEVRPELGHLAAPERASVRARLIVDAAVMMHGYAALMRDYNASQATLGRARVRAVWKQRLAKLSASNHFEFERWSGDFFAKDNPLWARVGVVKPSKDQSRLTVLNTGAARSECGRVLRQIVGVNETPRNLEFLAAH